MSNPLASSWILRSRAVTILTLVAPTVAATLALMALSAVDFYILGMLEPGASELDAFVASLPFVWGAAALVSSLGAGVQVVSARRVGAGDPEGAGRALANALIMSIVGGLIMFAAAWVLAPAASSFEPSSGELGVSFLRGRALGLPGLALFFVYRGFFDGVGRTRVFLGAALAWALTHVGGGVALGMGVGSWPDAGLYEVGVVGAVGVYAGLCVMVAVSLAGAARDHEIYRASNLSGRVCANLARRTWPPVVFMLMAFIGAAVVVWISGTLDAEATERVAQALSGDAASTVRGVDEALRGSGGLGLGVIVLDWAAVLSSARPPLYLEGATIVLGVLIVVSSVCVAFGGAAMTLVSQSLGRAEYAEAASYGWDASRLAMILCGGLGVLLIVWPDALLVRLSSDPLIVSTAAPGLQAMAAGGSFMAMVLVLAPALHGAGEVGWLVAASIGGGVVFVLLAYMFAFALGFGFLGVWFSGTLTVSLLAAWVAVKFKAGAWTEIKV